MRNWANVAKLTKVTSQGVGFVAQSAAGLPFLLLEGMEVYFVPPQIDMPTHGVITLCRMIDDYSAEIRFEGLASKEQNMSLVGSGCVVATDGIAPDVFEQPSALLCGFSVCDATYGAIGTVSEVNGTDEQYHLVVSGEDGHQTLIPFVDEFIDSLDCKSETIHTTISQGIWEL